MRCVKSFCSKKRVVALAPFQPPQRNDSPPIPPPLHVVVGYKALDNWSSPVCHGFFWRFCSWSLVKAWCSGAHVWRCSSQNISGSAKRLASLMAFQKQKTPFVKGGWSKQSCRTQENSCNWKILYESNGFKPHVKIYTLLLSFPDCLASFAMWICQSCLYLVKRLQRWGNLTNFKKWLW